MKLKEIHHQAITMMVSGQRNVDIDTMNKALDMNAQTEAQRAIDGLSEHRRLTKSNRQDGY